MKVIFMGTPDFAQETLRALAEAGHEVTLAVTQPDKPKGRGKNLQAPPVKEWAQSHGIPVYQPVKIKDPEALKALEDYEADIIVVAAFGQILPKELLERPKYGCINVHASLLPKYRGAAPIQWAVINGDEVSGVTIMKMDEGLDTGDIISQREVVLNPDETGGSLFDKLAAAGAELCVETMKKMEEGSAAYEKQGEDFTYAKMMTKQLGNINWSESAQTIERLIRGLNPWPSAYSYLNGKTMKIWKAEAGADLPGMAPGQMKTAGGELAVQTGEGSLVLQEIQLEGKKRMAAADFLRGYQIEEGTAFTRERR